MIRNLKLFSLPLAFGMLVSIPVHADEPDILISIDQKQTSLDTLQASDYEVPVFVRLEQNVKLNAIEFGIEVDPRCRFDVVTRSAYAQLYGEELGITMASASTSGISGYAWMTWMQQSAYDTVNSNLVMLLVNVPESAVPGDVYPIRYLNQAPSNPDKQDVWFNFSTNTDYARSDIITYTDGFIEIIGEIDYTPGDLNQDGSVDVLDVIMLNKSILGRLSLNPLQQKAADLDGDGVPSSNDSLMMLKKIVGLLD